jgi:antitoxin ParD1/3/4
LLPIFAKMAKKEQTMPSMNISLTPELMKLVQKKVKGGMYNNASEVMRDALRQMDTNAELLNQYKLNELRRALEPGLADIRNGNASEYTFEDMERDIANGKI